MPTKKFSLERGGPKRLEVSWKMMWRDIKIKLDGSEIGSIQNQKELEAGRDFALGDGTTLNFKLKRRIISLDLQLLRNGKPIPESASDPIQRLKSAYNLVFFVGSLNVLLGFGALLSDNAFLHTMLGDGVFAIFLGCVFLILTLFVKNRSALALGIAITILILDGLFAFTYIGPGATSGIVTRIFFLIVMAQGFSAIRELKEENKK
jgi:hypothetical protein